MTLGVLGGTFNPIHFAHLRIGVDVREALGLERVLLIPSADPPHKRRDLAPAADRVEMARLAVAGDPGFEVLDLELVRAGPSYTVDTLVELRRAYPGTALWFILGTDAFAELDTWRQPERLLELSNLAVVERPGHPGGDLRALLPERVAAGLRPTPSGLEHPSGCLLRSVPAGRFDISATDLRGRVARGASIRYLVPDAVRDYIEKHQLYREDA